MDRRKKEQNYRYGRLPAAAPLANPYVPFQEENSPVYEARKGFVRGTLYPGLDLPFKGMVNKNEKNVTPMTELQVLGFAIQDLALYLDTHRNDQEALEMYRSYQKMYQHCLNEIQKMRGPMNHTQLSEGKEYDWLNEPWPWEYSRNKEVR